MSEYGGEETDNVLCLNHNNAKQGEGREERSSNMIMKGKVNHPLLLLQLDVPVSRWREATAGSVDSLCVWVSCLVSIVS